MLTKTQEKHIKRIQEESLKIQERYVQSPYLQLNDQHWKEKFGDILKHLLFGTEFGFGYWAICDK